MQLDWVEVVGFRGIDRLAVDLGALTTIIGEPDGGKSSLLRAIGRALDPQDPDAPPAFTEEDFHRPGDGRAARAATLSITLGLRSDDDDPLRPDDERLRNGLRDGGVGIRVTARRPEETGGGDRAAATGAAGAAAEETAGARVVASVSVVDRAGSVIEGVDGAAMLAALRARHPAVVVGGPRRGLRRTAGGAGSRLQALLAGAMEPDAPLTWEQLLDVRDELAQAAGTLAELLAPPEARPRTVRDMADTPRPLVTDLGAALESDAGSQRRIAALWLLASVLDAVPPDGLGADAVPILLFDDIEANMHPTWLAAYSAVALNLPFQQVVATHSPEVLTWVPLSSIRRLARTPRAIGVHQVRPANYSTDELRRLTYHLRLHRGDAFFARCWVFVEGETEAWLLPEFARITGIEFAIEGIRVIEFAQAGLKPLAKVADDLGIAWLLVADGDEAGQGYARSATKHIERAGAGQVVLLPARDIEHYLFDHGYKDVIRKAAGRSRKRKAGELIRAAVDRVSKPGLALLMLAAADERGPEAVPPLIREVARTALGLARG